MRALCVYEELFQVFAEENYNMNFEMHFYFLYVMWKSKVLNNPYTVLVRLLGESTLNADKRKKSLTNQNDRIQQKSQNSVFCEISSNN